MRSFAILGTLVLVSLALPAGAAARAPELDRLVESWSAIHDFEVTITAHEVAGTQRQDRTFRYSFLRPDHAKLELLDGPMRGAVAVWNGGSTVTAHKRGLFAAFKESFDLHDHHVTSLRGNGLVTPELSAALRCFADHPQNVTEAAGPQLGTVATVAVSYENPAGLHCDSDSAADVAVTKDVFLVDPATHLPLRRMRYEGTTLVEDWELRDLQINPPLVAADFG
jgi:hypothetical protein